MKKRFTLIAFLLAVCCLAACGKKQETETEMTPDEIIESVIASQSELPELIQVTASDEEFDAYLSNYYKLERKQIADGILCYVDGVDANEIAVLVLSDESDASTIEKSLSAYIGNRAGDFAGYAPQQESLAKNGTVVTNGKYAALLICSDTLAAKTAFLNCFDVTGIKEEASPAVPPAVPKKLHSAEPEEAPSMDMDATLPVDAAEPENADTSEPAETSPTTEPDKPEEITEPEENHAPDTAEPENMDTVGPNSEISVPEPPANTTQEPKQEAHDTVKPAAVETPALVEQIDPNYNSGVILRAWNSGDTSALGEVNLSIYNAAKGVIDQNITGGMSSYEKELAIHDWITGWSSFSMSAFSHAPGGEEEYHVNTPYGVLINRSGTCWGYSATFQLFMDMLGIECITVYGNPNGGGVEHTWNQVKLDGEWYCVDTAWDDPIGGSPNHRYFNLTSDEFRKTGIHDWDETAVPEAAGTKYSYGA